MSYATMRDVLFALDLSDSEFLDQPRRHPDVPAAEPELSEERGERRRACSSGASMRSPATTMVTPTMTLAGPVTSAHDGRVSRALKSKKAATTA
jgi:hypothetical protein